MFTCQLLYLLKHEIKNETLFLNIKSSYPMTKLYLQNTLLKLWQLMLTQCSGATTPHQLVKLKLIIPTRYS